jgi:hypothetical protein
MKSLKNLFCAGLAVLAVAFAACKNDPPPYTPPGIDEFLSGLPNLDQTTVTGQPTVSVTGASLGGDDVGNVTIAGSGDGYTLSVSGGKLTLNLTTPTKIGNQTEDEEHFNKVKGIFLGVEDADPTGVFTPATTKFCIPAFYGVGSDGNTYYFERFTAQTDEKTYFVGSMIYYVYVNTDCKITSSAKDLSETDEEGSWTSHYNPINLSLKAGWNLVQENQSWAGSGATTITFKIADKDLPWEIYKN